MKSFAIGALISVALISTVPQAFAAGDPANSGFCRSVAARNVAIQFKEYLKNGGRRIDQVSCESSTSRRGSRYVKCEVSASNGKGGADMSFEAILTHDCRMMITAYITNRG